jgi:hypothetical protein
MTGIKRLVLDVLKPHQLSILEMARSISELSHVNGVNLSLKEVDMHTEKVKLTIEGVNIDFDDIEKVIQKMGAVIHSIDEVAAGTRLVEDVETMQDR